jgi:hypothetical protein
VSVSNNYSSSNTWFGIVLGEGMSNQNKYPRHIHWLAPLLQGRAIAETLAAGFIPRRPGFEPRSGHVGLLVDKVALGQVFSEYIGFPC